MSPESETPAPTPTTASSPEERARPAVYERVRAIVRRIPCGQVASYGQIAQIAGGCTPRMVGFCLSSLPPGSDVPWQRVINSQGRISPRGGGPGALLQRELLLEEGVEFSPAGRISFRRFGWLDTLPGELPPSDLLPGDTMPSDTMPGGVSF